MDKIVLKVARNKTHLNKRGFNTVIRLQPNAFLELAKVAEEHDLAIGPLASFLIEEAINRLSVEEVSSLSEADLTSS